jgi:hypothetical protein
VFFDPGNNYLDARARQDMLDAAQEDPRIKNAQRETYGGYNWTVDFDLRFMNFVFNASTYSSTTAVLQATYRSNPLLRWTAYFDFDRNMWTAWKQMY